MTGDCAAGPAGAISRDLHIDSVLLTGIAATFDSPHRFDNSALGAPCPVSTSRRGSRYRDVPSRAPAMNGRRVTRYCSLIGRAALVWSTGVRVRDRANDRDDTRTYQ